MENNTVRTVRSLRMLPILSTLAFILSCECRWPAQADDTPPIAELKIEWSQPDGGERSRTFDENDSDITIEADRNEPITVMYLAVDFNGVKSAELGYDMSRKSGLTIIRPMLLTLKESSNCPPIGVFDTHVFEAHVVTWTYEFETIATNWAGAVTKSAKVTVKTK